VRVPRIFATAYFIVLLASAAGIVTGAETAVSFTSLLDEMIDRDVLARLPDPAYTCRQASSYERLSVSPDDPDGWFANHDWSHFIRSEEIDGRTEWMMLDADGPGSIVRIWSGGPKPKGKMRFYLDGSAEPAIEMQTDELLGGDGLVGPPLSAVCARGLNLYLPIPYSKHCRITYDGPNVWQTKNNADRIWYNINYRTYAPGTRVESYSPAGFEAARPKIAKLQETLLEPAVTVAKDTKHVDPVKETLAPDAKMQKSLDGPGAIRRLSVRVAAADLAAATRSVVLSVSFDGRQTVWCPVGDFFGSGVRAHPYQGWWRTVADDGTMTSRWVMPYRESCTIALENLGEKDVEIALAVGHGLWTWDDRSMYFHTAWHQQYPIPTIPRRDFNYIEILGRGVLAGDTLAVFNPVRNWWGEGDEKIFVDGEKFPSHFGTGSEDYYGYAWGNPTVFSAPFHAQPSAGQGQQGHVTNTRSRSLDAIPFEKSLKLDIEVWHWAQTEVGYAAATYWYARPGATSNVPPAPDQARVCGTWPPESHRVEGALEGEALKILEKTGGVTEIQDIARHHWSGNRQLWWRDAAPGNTLVLALPVEKADTYVLKANLTKAIDYGIVRFSIDGKPLGEPMDLFNNGVITTGEIALGNVELSAGQHRLGLEITGANPKAEPRHMVGLDYVRLEPAPRAKNGRG